LGEFHKNRNNSTVFEELSVSIVDLTVANICFTDSFLFASPVKRHLRPSNPQLTPPTLQIQYCYSLNRLFEVVNKRKSYFRPQGHQI